MSIDQIVVVLEEAVIATEQNRKLLSSEFVVYLKVSVSTQIERMQGGRIPLLPIADMSAFLEQQHRERDSLYEKVATLIVESIAVEGADVDKTVAADINKIMKALEE